MSVPPPSLLADAAARAAALDPARSFLVEAPAGSGKTTLLTQRLLTLLQTARHPESILAITFSRKAAGEMRERVGAALSAAAAGTAPKNSVDAATIALARRVLETDRARGWNLLAQPSRLRILTIDAFNQWLAARLPILSNAGASLTISDRPAELYAHAARRLVADIEAGGALGDALGTVLRHLDNDVEQLELLLAGMLQSRDRWLRHVLASASLERDAELRALLEDALATLISAALQRVARRLSPPLGARLATLAVAAAGRMSDAGAGGQALIDARGTPAPSAAALAAWQMLATLLFTKEGEWRRVVNKNQGFPPEVAADKKAFNALLVELAAEPGLHEAFAEVARLPPPSYDEPQWAALLAMLRVLIDSAARLEQLFAEHGAVDFPAVQQAAIAALGSADEPSDLTLELDYRLQHILVDEFQDTSFAQVQLLELLTAGWQREDGRTLFLVGDPMQSIYGFREADVGLFLRVQQAGLGGIALERLTLSANFRSRPALIDWVNATFPRVLPLVADVARGAVPYSAETAVRPVDTDARVELVMLEAASAAAEAGRIAALVASERRTNPQATIAVLGRTRAPLAAVAAALRARGVAYQGVELVPLAERAAVRDLVALTRAICHPADRVAWLACLRAPWCGLGLEFQWPLAGDGSPLTVLELSADPARCARLPAPERARLERTCGVLTAALADRGRRPLAALIEATWIELGGPATLRDGSDLVNAATFFARLDMLEVAADLDDPVALADALDDLRAAPDADADEHVQLMTVHKAKGLEWDVVILAGLGRRARSHDEQLLRWLEFARADRGLGLVLAPNRARANSSDALQAWLVWLARERAELELGRLLYVGATRAKERLYLVANMPPVAKQGAEFKPMRGTALATLWPAIGPQAEARREPVAAPAAAANRSPPLERLADGWRPPAARAAVVALTDPSPRAAPSEFEFEWVTAVARHVGTVVHAELEHAAQGSLEEFEARLRGRAPRWRRALLELGVGDEQLPAALERVARALASTLADARGRWLFDPSHRSAASELALSSIAAGRVVAARIDRTFVDTDGVRWIVDFKTSLHEGLDLEQFLDREQQRYAPQLESYARLLAEYQPAARVRLGLYFALHARWREWPAPGSGGSPS